MKLNKKYLIESILEVMNESSQPKGFSFKTAKEFEDWLYAEYLNGVKYLKRGESGFEYDHFKEVVELFLSIEWDRFKRDRPWYRSSNDHRYERAYKFSKEAGEMFPFVFKVIRSFSLNSPYKPQEWWDKYYKQFWIPTEEENKQIEDLKKFAKKLLGALSFSGRHTPTFKKGVEKLGQLGDKIADNDYVKTARWMATGDIEEGKQKLDKKYLFHLINEVLREADEEDDQEPIDLLKSKIENIIPQKDWGFYVQFFDLIDTFEDSALIEKEEANALRERLWGAVWFLKVYSTENLDEVAELFLTHKNLPEDTKEDIHSSIYYYGGYFRDDEWTLKYVAKSLGLNLKIETIDPDNLYEISGADGDTLDKFRERLIELGEEEKHFEIYTETGGLLFGVLAQPYVHFEKKIEEIFGATPSGDPMMAGGSYQTVSIKKSIDEPFDAPMVKGGQVTADIMFEWSPDQEYGMEITLFPPRLGTTPQTLLQDYYGIWVSTAQDGPNIGKLEIGIQNYEDEFADHKQVQNNNGTYGFTVDEMKEKIKEMTGIDLNEIN